MKVQLNIPLGNKRLVIEGDSDEKTAISRLSFWSQLPEKCGACESQNIGLQHRQPKGFDYYGLHCTDCGADFNFGQLKTGGFYVKQDETWKVFKRDESNGNNTQEEQMYQPNF